MALSGSFSGSIAGGKYKLRVDWSATQNTGGNTSKVTMVLYLVQASSWSLNISARADNPASIAGTAYTWDASAINNGGGKTTKLATITSGNIAHNADGTKTISLSARFDIKATISGTYYSSISASTSVTLNTIPRATQPTLSASSADMGSTVTINMPRASSNFTHDLAYRFNSGSWVSIATGRGTSHSWTVPDLASQIPNTTSGTLTVRCSTKNGGTTVGTKTVSMTAKVPSSVIPTISAVTTTEATAGLAAQFGAFVQNKSALAVAITAAGAKGSTIKAYKSTLLGKTYTTRTFTSGLLTSSGTITISTQVQDSRGRWSAAKKTNVTVLAYSKPQIQAFTVWRADAAGAADENGIYAAAAYRYSVSSLGSKNTAAMKIEYKRTTLTNWATLLTGSALSANTTAKPTTPTFSLDYQWDLRLTVTDWFGASATYSATLPSERVVAEILADGTGLSIGKTCEASGLDIGWPIVGEVQNMGAQVGQVKLHGGLLIQWGAVSITPEAADSPTTKLVTFQQAYKSTPMVWVSPATTVPQNVSVGAVRTGVSDTLKGINVVLARNSTTATTVNWLAIGPG